MADANTRTTDTELLIQFAKGNADVTPEVLGAIQRLEDCHVKELIDYAHPKVPFDSRNV